MDREITLPKEHPVCRFYGVQWGAYEVLVGDWGWDDGDLFIDTNQGPYKLRDLKQMGELHGF